MSSLQAKAYHSITIGNKNTWDDWGLIPTSRPKFNMPTKKTNYVDIPGGDSSIDLSEALTGYPIYNDREGTFEFYVDMDCSQNAGKSWDRIYSDIAKYIHGKTFVAKLDDECTDGLTPSGYYYKGVFSLNEWVSNSDGTGSLIKIDYKVKPYKYNINEYETEYIIGPDHTAIGSSIDITNTLDIMPVNPTIRSTAAVRMTYTDTDGSDTTVQLSTGIRTYNQITFCAVYRSIYIEFNAAATITMSYRNGRL